MANILDSISKTLALNLTGLRKKRGLSQAALAKISGIPRSTIAHIESGQGNPSLSHLTKLSSSLLVSLEELLTAQRPVCKLIRARDVRAIRRSQGVAEIHKLLPDPLPGMEIDRMEIQAGGRMGGVPHVPGTKEYLTVIKGKLTVHVAGLKFEVLENDVLAFPGDQAHSYQNAGNKLAICFSVVALAPVGV